MPGWNTFPWNRIENTVWTLYYKGVITESEAWERLTAYWVASALINDHFVGVA